MYKKIQQDAITAVSEILEKSDLKSGQILVIGCSSSEIVGGNIGKASSPEAAKAVLEAVYPMLKEKGIYLAAQCCEHLNRALVIERDLFDKINSEEVCVRPRATAGGSFATAYYEMLDEPVMVEFIKAHAGLDIGETLIGMHLKHVAVPLRLKQKYIGEARITAAKTRAKLIGGERADYPAKIR